MGDFVWFAVSALCLAALLSVVAGILHYRALIGILRKLSAGDDVPLSWIERIHALFIPRDALNALRVGVDVMTGKKETDTEKGQGQG